MGEWDAYFLGRKLIEGIASASRIALLVCSMVEQTSTINKLPKYQVSCNKESGIRLLPLRRMEDEGFESETDTGSLGSSEESASPDSAHGSGTSDSEDLEDSKVLARGKKSYSIEDVAFCHTDGLFPKILVLAIKTRSSIKKTTYSGPDQSGGLEAVVLQFRNEDRLKEICKTYHELRRRSKLDWRRGPDRHEEKRSTEETAPVLVRRTDEDGVTHIEVSCGERRIAPRHSDPASHILSIDTPDATETPKCVKEIESVIRTDVDNNNELRGVLNHLKGEDEKISREEPPKRPERKKHSRKNVVSSSSSSSSTCTSDNVTSTVLTNKNKLIKGLLVSVVVQPKPSSSETPETSSKSKSVRTHHETKWKDYCNDKCTCKVNSENWCSGAIKSKSPRRRTPMAYRYVDTVPQTSSLSNRFFGKLREIANGSVISGSYSSNVHRRRNSSSDMPKSQFYKYFRSETAKSTPNLKSVIKTKCKDGAQEHSGTKKVTFSAYATVQVVD